MSLYDSAIKYAMKILNREPDYSLDRLRRISERAYIIAKKYIDDINSSRKHVQKIIYAGWITNLNLSYIKSQYEGWKVINNAVQNNNNTMFVTGVNIISEGEEEYCRKLALYIPQLQPLNLNVTKIKIKIDTIRKAIREAKGFNAIKVIAEKNMELANLIDEANDLREQRFNLIDDFLEKENIR